MHEREVTPPHWWFVYGCGHEVLFTAPRTPDEVVRLTAWLEQFWRTRCAQCPRLDESEAKRPWWRYW